MSTPRYKHVALVIDSMMAPRRTMMNGVARFMQEHEAWSIYLKPPYVATALLDWLKSWHGDGVMGKLTAEEADALCRAGIPFVDTGGFELGEEHYVVRADDHEIGRVGASHLLERGLKHFAFVELAEANFARDRFAGFASRLGESGFTAHRYIVLKPSAGPGGPADWENQQEVFGGWIASLAKPVGIMATTDFVGRQVLEACQRINVTVPDQVAVLGADNDEPICRISTPPLSSVIINDEQRGYEAAFVLGELMNGRSPARKTVLVSPVGVKTRASTDVFAFEDELMVSAMRYLREHFDQHTGVEQLAEVLGVSRSTLDRKFRRVLGRSVNDEVIALRITNAVRLLSETQLPLKVIAFRSGFSSQAYMSTVFRMRLSRTPNSYRH